MANSPRTHWAGNEPGERTSVLSYLLAVLSNSEEQAISLGGHLVTINDAAEQDFVYTNFANYGGSPHNLWIGLRRNALDYNEFVWASGQPITYTLWAPGEPNNCGGIEPKGMITPILPGCRVVERRY